MVLVGLDSGNVFALYSVVPLSYNGLNFILRIMGIGYQKLFDTLCETSNFYDIKHGYTLSFKETAKLEIVISEFATIGCLLFCFKSTSTSFAYPTY